MTTSMKPVALRAAALLSALLVVVSAVAAAQQTEVRPAPAQRSTLDARRSSIKLPSLSRPVEVRYDNYGIPHIYATTQSDLFMAQGFVAARDRLFQMEMWRRQAEGRLAEVMGPAFVERDRFARLFKYRGDMTREWQSYAPDTKSIVTAFVRGVNAYMAHARDSLPVEFGMLRLRPEPWTPEVALARVTGLSGSSNASSEVLRAQLVQQIGREKVDALLPTDPPRPVDPAPGLDLDGIGTSSLGGFGSTFQDIAYNRIEGSNNWVVSGSKTVTGKPILANDPHRVITNPAVRYITHLVGPGWNVIGAGEPAAPGVPIGHNERIGFGLTVVGMDQQDVYVERLGACPAVTGAQGNRAPRGPPPNNEDRPAGLGERNQSVATASASSRPFDCYWHDNRWKRVRVIRDTIRVKGEAPRVVQLAYTVHGAILTVDSARSRAIVLRSVYDQPGTAAYLAALSLGRARNWKDFEAAMARWQMPSENMIYADVDGNIGWIAAGLMPKRSWSGLLPVPGDGSREWTGFVPGRELPRAYNPASGFIATSNDNILPAGYPIALSHEWASRYRIDRVRDVLQQDRKFSIDDFKRLQHDDHSKLAEAIVPHLIAAASRLGAGARPSVRTFAAWNYRMARDQHAPLLFSAWSAAAYRRVAETRDAGPATATLAARPNFSWLEQLLAAPDALFGADAPRGRDSLLLLALDDAETELSRRFGVEWASKPWGDVHVASFRHPLSSKYDLPPVSRGGDGNTVYATGGRDYRQNSGASYRQIIDFADFDNSVATNVPGQSANPLSPHYGDLLPIWGRDEYIPLLFSRKRVEAATRDVVWLRP